MILRLGYSIICILKGACLFVGIGSIPNHGGMATNWHSYGSVRHLPQVCEGCSEDNAIHNILSWD